jgi:hypothetical protein
MIQTDIPGYTYGTDAVSRSPVRLGELGLLQATLLLGEDDRAALRRSVTCWHPRSRQSSTSGTASSVPTRTSWPPSPLLTANPTRGIWPPCGSGLAAGSSTPPVPSSTKHGWTTRTKLGCATPARARTAPTASRRAHSAALCPRLARSHHDNAEAISGRGRRHGRGGGGDAPGVGQGRPAPGDSLELSVRPRGRLLTCGLRRLGLVGVWRVILQRFLCGVRAPVDSVLGALQRFGVGYRPNRIRCSRLCEHPFVPIPFQRQRPPQPVRGRAERAGSPAPVCARVEFDRYGQR